MIRQLGSLALRALAIITGLILPIVAGAQVIVVDYGQSLTISEPLVLGSDGITAGEHADGFVRLTGTTLSSGTSHIGRLAGSQGEFEMTGGSDWSNSAFLYVGDAGTGTLSIFLESSLSSFSAWIGNGVGSVGSVFLDNASTWTNSSALRIGNAGVGSLSILGASSVTAGATTIGGLSGSTGSVLISGPGSRLSASSLTIGLQGNGEVTVSSNGRLEVGGGSGTVYLGTAFSGRGTINLGARADEAPPSSAGVLGVAAIVGGDGAGGLLQINALNASYLTSDGTANGQGIDLSGNLEVMVNRGGVFLAGDATHTGGTRILNGFITVGVGGANGSLSGDVSLESSTALLRFNRSDNVTFAGNVTGAGYLQKYGDGILTLTGEHHGRTGGTDIVEGGLRLAADNQLHELARLTVAPASFLDLGEHRLRTGALYGSGTVMLEGGTLTLLDGPEGNEINSFNGAITGVGDLTVERGPIGRSILNGAVSLEGAVVVRSGELLTYGTIELAETQTHWQPLLILGRAAEPDPYAHLRPWYDEWLPPPPAEKTAQFVLRDGASVAVPADYGVVVGGRDEQDNPDRLPGRGVMLLFDSQLNSGGGVIAERPGDTGRVEIAGADAVWTTDALTVGRGGDGVLTLLDGGTARVTQEGAYGSGDPYALIIGQGERNGTNDEGEDVFVGSGRINIGRPWVGVPNPGGIIDAQGIWGGAGGGMLFFNTTSTAEAPYYFTRTGTAGPEYFDRNVANNEISVSIHNSVNLAGNAQLWHAAGFTVVTGSLTHTGGTRIAGGTLQIGTGTNEVDATLSGNVQVDAGTNLIFQNAGDQTFDGNLAGSGTLQKAGTNTLTLSGDSAVGPLVVHEGTLEISGGGKLVTGGPASIGSPASEDSGYGPPRLLVREGGEWQVDGPDPVVGATTDGILRVEGEARVTVRNGAGNIILGDNTGHEARLEIATDTVHSLYTPVLAVGGVVGASSSSKVNLNTGNVENRPFHFTSDGTAGGAGISLSGLLGLEVWSGHNILTGPGSFTGLIELLGGFLELGSTDVIGDVAPIYFRGGTLRYSPGNQRDYSARMTNSSEAGFRIDTNGQFVTFASPLQIYDPSPHGKNSLEKLGLGTLRLSANSTYSGTTLIAGGWIEFSDPGVFGSSSITLDGGGLRWATGAAPLFPTAFNPLGSGGGGSFDTNGNTITLGSTLSGAGSMTKTGAGTLILTGSNTNTGTMTVESGVLQIGDEAGTAGILADVHLTNDTSVVFASAGNTSFAGAIGGTGDLIKRGDGGLTLTGQSDFSGDTRVEAGSLLLGANQALPAGTRLTLLSDSTFDLGSRSQTVAEFVGGGNLVMNGGSLTFGTGEGTSAFGGVIAGTGSLQKTGGSTVVLDGNSTFTGIVTIGDGALRIGSGGSSGLLPASFQNHGTLVLDRADDFVFSGSVSGSGLLVNENAGVASLTGTVNPGGGTEIRAGTLRVGNAGTTGTLQGAVVASPGATLAFARSDAVTFSGILSGGGGLRKESSNTLTLGVAQTYTGPTTIAAGTLSLGGSNRLSQQTAVAISSGATLNMAGLDQTIAGLSGAGAVSLGSGILRVRTDATGPVYSGAISGSGGSLVKQGAATLVLSGTNSYTGGTTVAGGRLQIGHGGTSGVIVGNVVVHAGAELAYNRTDTVTLDGSVTGAGDLIQMGPGTMVLGGPATHTGLTLVEGGTLQINATVSGLLRAESGGHITLGSGANLSNGSEIFIESGGSLTLGSHANGINRFYNRVLTNHGTVHHNASSVGLNTNTVITNHGTWTSALPGTGQSGGFVTGDGQTAGGEFINHGTFNKTGLNYLDWNGANTGPGFTNHGTLNVQSGTMAIHSRGTFSGTSVANIASGATLLLRDGTNHLQDGARFLGAGTLALGDAGQHHLNGTIHADNASFGGGTLHGTHTLTGTWNKSGSGGNMGTAGTTTIASGATWNFQASTNLRGRTFVNQGTVNRADGQLEFSPETLIQNHGTWNDANQGNSYVSHNAPQGGFFENFGTFNKAAAGTLSFASGYGGPAFTNHGTVNVNQGTFQILRTSTFTGTSVVNTAAGATLELRDGTNHLQDGARFLGAGTLALGDAGQHHLNGTIHADNASIGGGTLHGTHTLRGNWTLAYYPNVATSGTTTIAADGTWQFAAATNNLSNRSFVNHGVVTHTSGHIAINAASTITNHGTWTDSSGASFVSSGDRVSLIENRGTFIKTGANTLTVDYYNGPVFSNLGTVDVQQGTLQLHRNLAQHSGSTLTGGTWIVRHGATLRDDYTTAYTVNQGDVTLHGTGNFAGFDTLVNNQGTLRLLDGKTFSTAAAFANSGTLVVGTGSSFSTTSTFTNSGTLELLGSFNAAGGLTNTGTLGGGGTFTGSLTSGGTLSPGTSPGLLTITGNLTLLSTSQLIMELGGLVESVSHDHIDVGGTLTFGGELVVSLLDGFSPVSGASFNLFDAAAFSGTFATLVLPTLSAGLSWDTDALYTSGLLSVTTTAVPEPSTYAIIAGLAALALAARRRRA